MAANGRQAETAVNALFLLLYMKGHRVSSTQAENTQIFCREEGIHHGLPFAGWGSDWNRKNAFPPSS